MIDVTPLAVEKLKAVLEEEQATDSAVRVIVLPAGQGVQYMLTLEQDVSPDDVVTEADGLRLLVDLESVPFVEGARIDYVEDLMRAGFVITNPNMPVGGGCACGGSGACACGGH